MGPDILVMPQARYWRVTKPLLRVLAKLGYVVSYDIADADCAPKAVLCDAKRDSYSSFSRNGSCWFLELGGPGLMYKHTQKLFRGALKMPDFKANWWSLQPNERENDPDILLLANLIDLLLGEMIVESCQIVQAPAASVVNYYDELIDRISTDIHYVHALTPRQFEEFVAEILCRDGFEVELTKQTRDGGIDIFAKKKDNLASMLYGIECKKYSPDRPIGVSIIRELATSIRENHCNVGVLCTTSRFTTGAVAAAESHLIYPHDVRSIHNWVLQVQGASA